MNESCEMVEVVVHILRPGVQSAARGVEDPYLCGIQNRWRPGIEDNWVYASEGCATCPACISAYHEGALGADGRSPQLARILQLVAQMDDAVADTRGHAGDDARIEALGRYDRASAALSALLSSAKWAEEPTQ